jgi:hypothetical protein
MRAVRAVLTLLAAVAVAAAGALAVLTLVRFHGGPLDDAVGSGLSGPWPANVPLAFGLLRLENDSTHTVVVERLRLGSHTSAVAFLGARVAAPRCYDGSTMASFPPRGRAGCRFRSPDGVTLRPHERLEGFVGVKAPSGSYRIHGVVVDYRRPLARGVSLRFRARGGLDWGVCMTPHWPHRCKPPSFPEP